MSTRREVVTDPSRLPQRDRSRGRNVFEELMSCPPGVEPDGSVADGQGLRTIIDKALQSLNQLEPGSQAGRMRFVVQACVIERSSLRSIGRQLGLSKTHVARIRDAGLQHLRDALAADPHIQEALHD